MAARYPLNLPVDLKQDAIQLAREQGISLNQFILWSISEKVCSLKSRLDDPKFPFVTYRRGASGLIAPVLRGTGIHIETLVVAHRQGETAEALAEDFGVSVEAVKEALAFYQSHRNEIDHLIQLDQELVDRHDQAQAAS